jgi:hypothetical protein
VGDGIGIYEAQKQQREASQGARIEARRALGVEAGAIFWRSALGRQFRQLAKALEVKLASTPKCDPQLSSAWLAR